jgi:squalene-hopene/tetraprenyl-beta-curcumene cyclase
MKCCRWIDVVRILPVYLAASWLSTSLSWGTPPGAAGAGDPPGKTPTLTSEADRAARGIQGTGIDPSTLKDVNHTLDQGFRWLAARQNEDGSWSQPGYPALTALAVMAYAIAPRAASGDSLPPAAEKGVLYLLRCVQPDGGIYVPSDKAPSMPHYNTSISLSALALVNRPSLRGVIQKAQQFLIKGQHLDEDVYRGGFGYEAGGKREYADLSSTYMVLEAAWMAERLELGDESATAEAKKLNWQAAIEFLSRVQNLPGSNDQPWAQDPLPDDRGGFVYHPGESKAGDEVSDDGSRRFHSYGSMSYAGLLSFIYADVNRDDARVQAAADWIRRHYTMEENAGMGVQGLYFNYHTMAKALSHWGEDPLVLADGRKVWWRKDLALKLVSLQRIDPELKAGYWVNDNGRWWENDPILSTCYSMVALQVAAGPALQPQR